jgi:hypothetical protein
MKLSSLEWGAGVLSELALRKIPPELARLFSEELDE